MASTKPPAAFAFASAAVFTGVGEMLGKSPNLFVKAAVHGVAGGALSVGQGGNFLQGFAANAFGAVGGSLASGGELAGTYGDGIPANQIARALISGAAGCAGASVTGGKCADAAVTAAFASLYNGDQLGRFPPAPPGYNSGTWEHGKYPNGKYWLVDPETGRRYIVHPEDRGHWRHWDYQDPDDQDGGGGNSGTWPENAKKIHENQKIAPYGGQSPADPSGNAPEWRPTIIDEFSDIDPWPLTHPHPFGRGLPYLSPRMGGSIRMPAPIFKFP